MNPNSIRLHNVEHRLFLAIFIILLSVSLAGHAQAQTSVPPSDLSIQLQAAPAFDGNYKYGEWLPVFVELMNNGPDLQASIRVPVSGVSGTVMYETPVELPSGSHKRLTLYVLPNNFTRQLNVELISGEKLLASQRIDVQPNPNVNFLAGLISPGRGALSLISSIEIPGTKRQKILVDIPLFEIPEKSEGLRSFDLIVLNGADSSALSPEQAAALEAWVRQGGQLVIGGGSRSQITTSGLPSSLFPARVVQTVTQSDLPALEQYVGGDHPIQVPGPFVVAKIDTSSGRSLAGSDQQPLIHQWEIGKGAVFFIALDLAVSPFDAWNGTAIFWQNLVAPGAIYPDNIPTDVSARQQFASSMPYALSNLPVLDLPSARGLALMLFIYIIVVGPTNYLVLRRLKKLQLAWITIPVITVIFSAGSFGLGYVLHGTDIFINKISLIQVESSGSAHFDSYIGIFSPAQTNYRVEVQGSSLLSPLGPYYDPWNSVGPASTANTGKIMTLIQGEPAYVNGLSIDQWSMQSFMAEGSIEDFGVITADLHLENDRISGSIINTSSNDFQDSFVIIGSRFFHTGQILTGEKANVDLDLAGLGSPSSSPSLSYAMFEQQLSSTTANAERRQNEAKRSIVENIFERTPPYVSFGPDRSNSSGSTQAPVFIGWIEAAPPDVRIPGIESAAQSSAIVLTPLSYKLPDAGMITIPVGLIPGRLVENPREGGICGMTGMTAVYISRGQAIMEFYLPPESASLTPESLKFGLWSDSGLFDPPSTEIYDWDSASWISLTGLNQGINLIPTGSNYIDTNGVVRIRLSEENGQNCYYLGLGLEGSR